MTVAECLAESGLVIESPLMRDAVGQIERAVASRAGVLLIGEPGTGRGLIAQTIHACGTTAAAPFVAVDGRGLAAAEAERAVFGVSGNGRGSVARTGRAPEVVYPGALLHQALGGTIFFRHLEDLPARVQARLASLLRDREFVESPRGEALPFPVRPIAAVEPDFQARLDDRQVRQDLQRRVAELRIAVPTLRERREDIPALAQRFADDACAERGLPRKTLDDAARALLAAMPWRGNSRELRDLLAGLVNVVPDETITLQNLLDHVTLDASSAAPPGRVATLREARVRFEQEYIAAVVAHHHGRIPPAARALGMQRTNLYRKLRALRLAVPPARPRPS